jgi:hypothetical protein
LTQFQNAINCVRQSRPQCRRMEIFHETFSRAFPSAQGR